MRQPKGVLRWREGRLHGEGSGGVAERPLKVGVNGGVSSRTCWQVEDTGVSLLELLVATNVPLHWSVHEDM